MTWSPIAGYRVLQARVAIVGPAGMCFKVRAQNENPYDQSIRINQYDRISFYIATKIDYYYYYRRHHNHNNNHDWAAFTKYRNMVFEGMAINGLEGWCLLMEEFRWFINRYCIVIDHAGTVT